MGKKWELDIALSEKGFEGEYTRDDKVWIVYTHFPVLSDFEFTTKRIIVGVRNPLDVFDSLFNMGLTFSQTKCLTPE